MHDCVNYLYSCLAIKFASFASHKQHFLFRSSQYVPINCDCDTGQQKLASLWVSSIVSIDAL